MKILFFGDCMFGRDQNEFVENPFIHVKQLIKKADIIIFNLETVVSKTGISDYYKEHKTFNYVSNGKQLLALRKITKKPIFASISNNHSLDYGLIGLHHTKIFLREQNIYYSDKKMANYKDGICFISATDHCGCKNIDEWAKHIWVIDYKDTKSIMRKIRNLSQRAKKSNKLLVFSIHWGANWLTHITNKMKLFGRLLN